jgi:hypothetical protein
VSTFIYPFHIGAPVGAQGNISRIPDVEINTERENLLELVCLSGGPVFLTNGRVELGQAFSNATGADPNLEFDLAANVNASTVREIGSVSNITLWAAQETVGYVRLVEGR